MRLKCLRSLPIIIIINTFVAVIRPCCGVASVLSLLETVYDGVAGLLQYVGLLSRSWFYQTQGCHKWFTLAGYSELQRTHIKS